MPHIIGIDLGTTNSVVAFFEKGKAEVIPNSEGNKITPSVALYRASDEPVVGELAKRQHVTQPQRTVRSVKRLMGRRLEEIEELRARLPYDIRSHDAESVEIVIDGVARTPVEISGHILAKMRKTAADFLGEDAGQAVITVPAHFNDSQRQATKLAAQEAGLEVLRIINEPTAAALAYGLRKEKIEKIAVFDFGGGTFDISILELDEDVFEVRSTNGDTDLGGDNIDDVLARAIEGWILEETGTDPKGDLAAMQRIREAAERTKCELSTLQSTLISLPFIVAGADGPKHFSREVTREMFEALAQPVFERLKNPCRMALADARLSPEEIDSVILVGGSTRIPAVQAVARDLFGREPLKTLNPDEAVAIGAAIQAGVITGAIEEVLLLDVTPLSLGIEVEGGVFRTLIPRNSSIPLAVSRRFTTTRNNQNTVSVHVLQGERPVARENRSLAHLRLAGIAAAPAEVPEIEVSFAIDADGILSVTATDLTSGVQKEIVVESYATAATQDVKQAIEAAEVHTEEDRAFLHRAQIKQKALGTQRSVQAFLDASEGELAEDDVTTLRHQIFRLDVAGHANDIETMLEAEAILMKIAEKYSDLYFVHRVGE